MNKDWEEKFEIIAINAINDHYGPGAKYLSEDQINNFKVIALESIKKASRSVVIPESFKAGVSHGTGVHEAVLPLKSYEAWLNQFIESKLEHESNN